MHRLFGRDYKIIHPVRAGSIILLIPVVLIVLYINRIAVKQTRAKLLSDEQATLEVWMESIDNNIRNGVLVANELVINSQDIVELENANNSADRFYALVEIQMCKSSGL